ncbi:MAG: sulfurtransferase [Chloroflexi bacterium]|nr:sulfurtransferase [Chloroflexota bacterium]
MPTLPVRERGYARPDLLAETDWLAAHLGDPYVRVVDARPVDQYATGHLPGAVNLYGMTLRSAHSPLEIPDPEEFAVLAGGLGVDAATTVVVYDATGPPAGRVAWAFLHYGHQSTRLLDGGLTKWTQEGRPVTAAVPSYLPLAFRPRPTEGLSCGLDYAKACVGRPGVVLWDVRAAGEYDGSDPRDNPPGRAGHLPGAVHLEWSSFLDPITHTLKPAADLRRLLEAKGITPEAEVVAY